jgi:ABC-type sugar transport system permease subunit
MQSTTRQSRAGLLLLPFFALFAAFWAMPLVEGVIMSVHGNVKFGDAPYVGLGNYTYMLFQEPRYWKAVRNTIVFTVCSVGLIVPLALLLAHLVRASHPKLRPIYSFILLLPGLTPPIALGIMFLLVFVGDIGILNHAILQPLGIESIDWMKDPRFIMSALVMQAVWRWVGFIAFFFLAALDGIPRQHLEAAWLEGAERLQTFRYVTLPMLKHVLVFAAVYLIVDAVTMVGSYILLGGSGGTKDAALMLVNYSYQSGLKDGWFGFAAAMSLSVVPVMLFVMWLLLLRRRRTL